MASMRSLTSGVFLDRSPRFFQEAATAALTFIMGEKNNIDDDNTAQKGRVRDNERKVRERTNFGSVLEKIRRIFVYQITYQISY
jgi:hypothetical protein